jgi:hypothetical protein
VASASAQSTENPSKTTKAASAAQSNKNLRKVYLGRATWICTPSGFGQKARCFQRSRVQ